MPKNIRLRTSRVLRGLTQLELADLIGIREIEISRYETGRAKPDPETKRRIAEILEKPTYELFND